MKKKKKKKKKSEKEQKEEEEEIQKNLEKMTIKEVEVEVEGEEKIEKKKKKKKEIELEEEIVVETPEEEEEILEIEEIEFLFLPPEKPEREIVKYDETVEKLFPKKDWVFICNKLWDSTQRFFQIEYLNTNLETKSAPNSPEMKNKNNISQTSFNSEANSNDSPRTEGENSFEQLGSPRNFISNESNESINEGEQKKKKIKNNNFCRCWKRFF